MTFISLLILGAAFVGHAQTPATVGAPAATAECRWTKLSARGYSVTPYARETIERLAFDEAKDSNANVIQAGDHERVHRDVLKMIFGPVDDVQVFGGGQNWYNGFFSEFTYQVSFNFRFERDVARMSCRTEFARGALTLGSCSLHAYAIHFARTPRRTNDTARIILSQDRILKELVN